MALIFVTRCLIFALTTAVSFALYRLLLHPLARVPGPRLATLSNAWHAYQARNGLMLRVSKQLHRQYGPVVRVGPNEVWFDSKEAFVKIYSMLIDCVVPSRSTMS